MDVRASDDPVRVLRQWFAEAQTGADVDCAMALASVGEHGMPSVRIVLCRGIEDDGSLRFYTNYRSRKARELDAHPMAAVVFHWPRFGRQLRVEGDVERVAAEISDGYFAQRPRESQLSAWASPQSEAIDPELLGARVVETKQRFADRDVDRPPWWGGYRLRPRAIELWRHQDGRLHQRLGFRRDDGAWHGVHLAP